jgi:transmembrane sensor
VTPGLLSEMNEKAQQRRDEIEREAALWVVRADGETADPTRQGKLEAWLELSPEHELAYARQLRAWDRMGEALTEAGGPMPRRSRPRARESRRPLVRPQLRRAAAWASVAVIGAGLAGVLWLSNAGTAYATGVGEHRVIRLQDGSRVEMNTATKMVVRYTLTGRNIELQKGEALFEVAPNKNRPFNVMADHERVRAVGTAFNVRVRGEGIDVLVSKGVVEVGPQHAADGGHRRLTAGVMASFLRSGDTVQSVSSAEIERTLAWRYGAIALNGQSLEQAADEFNRYNVRQLRVADPQIADLKLGGYFRADDLDNFVRALKVSFGVEVTSRDNQTLYLSRAR